MRQITTLIFLLVFAHLADAQLPKKVKHDSVVYSKDSSLALIEYKQKQALYKVDKKEYEEKAGAYTYVYIPGVDCFFATSTESGKTKLYEPKQTGVNRKESGFLLEHYSLREDGTRHMFSYSFVSNDKRILFSYESSSHIFGNPEYWTLCLEDIIADTLFDAPGGLDRHSAVNHNRYYYVVGAAGEMGIVRPQIEGGELVVKWGAKPEEFVHYNPDLDFEFWLQDDSIYFKSPDNYAAVSQQWGSIVYTKDIANPHTDENFLLVATDDHVTALENDYTDTSWIKNVASIQIKNGFLLINDLGTRPNSNYVLESENSAVWKKENGRWTRISPYYASVAAIPGGFIARSGSVLSIDNRSQWNIPSRYFLLDSNCKVIPFMDYYDFALIEDLGFGLKVSFDNDGCFFMTYDRVAVTDAEWDHFELFNGKLQATKSEKPLLDEFGNQVYDEHGVPLKSRQKETMFFKIP